MKFQKWECFILQVALLCDLDSRLTQTEVFFVVTVVLIVAGVELSWSDSSSQYLHMLAYIWTYIPCVRISNILYIWHILKSGGTSGTCIPITCKVYVVIGSFLVHIYPHIRSVCQYRIRITWIIYAMWLSYLLSDMYQ